MEGSSFLKPDKQRPSRTKSNLSVSKSSVEEFGLKPFEDDVSDFSGKACSKSDLSTFTEIAERVNKFVPTTGYKSEELDWFELESKIREMVSTNIKSIIKSIAKNNKKVQQINRTCEITK